MFLLACFNYSNSKDNINVVFYISNIVGSIEFNGNRQNVHIGSVCRLCAISISIKSML